MIRYAKKVKKMNDARYNELINLTTDEDLTLNEI